MTECINRNNVSGSSARINVSRLLLFDAPLFGPIVHGDENIFTKQLSNNAKSTMDNSSNNLEQKVTAHFNYCTKLLQEFYNNSQSPYSILAKTDISNSPDDAIYRNILGNCDIVIFRACEIEIGNLANDNANLFQQLTSAHIGNVIKSPGNHWTMLFSPNASYISRVIKEKCVTV